MKKGNEASPPQSLHMHCRPEGPSRQAHSFVARNGMPVGRDSSDMWCHKLGGMIA